MSTLGNIEATDLLGSEKLAYSGLSVFTADCILVKGMPLSRVETGPYTHKDIEVGNVPSWSAGRLLALLPTSDNFYWSLYRADGYGNFVLTVFADGKEHKFTDKRLINVVMPAMLLCLETYNLPSKFRRGDDEGVPDDLGLHSTLKVLSDAVSSGSISLTEAFHKKEYMEYTKE